MSLRRNIASNYVSQIYVSIIGIVFVPLYLEYMGAEAYGLVGFFALLQSWFGLLDLGLTPTVARETARYRGGAISARTFAELWRALSVIFTAVAIIGGGGLLLMSDLAASEWLTAKLLKHSDVVVSLQIMAVSVAMRWMGGLYRGVVVGSERLVWISAFNVLTASSRFVFVMLTMWAFGFTPLVFFLHQLVVAGLELLGLFLMSQRLMPPKEVFQSLSFFNFSSVKPLLRFGLTIAFTSSIWILVTQTDKLVLSGILPLAEYGYFSLAVLVASGIMIISGPISNAIMPRMARLHAEGKGSELISLYRKSTRLVGAAAGSIALSLFVCAKPLLYFWSGNPVLTENAAPILSLYAAGNGILAIGAFPYYLQYSRGDLKYHLIGNLFLFGLIVPLVLYVAPKFGGVGAGYVWIGTNLLYLLVWVAYIHRKLEPGLHIKWLINDVGFVVGAPLILVLLMSMLPISGYIESYDSRLGAFFKAALVSISIVGLSFLMYFLAGKRK